MRSNLIRIGLLFLTATLGTPAYAVNINTSGVVCQHYNASEAADIDYFTTGVRNLNAATRYVVCAMPRSPLSASATPTFFIDGYNFPNSSTSCIISVYNSSGTTTESVSFTQTATSSVSIWRQPVTFPIGSITSSDYVSALCLLPARGFGIIRGATVQQ